MMQDVNASGMTGFCSTDPLVEYGETFASS